MDFGTFRSGEIAASVPADASDAVVCAYVGEVIGMSRAQFARLVEASRAAGGMLRGRRAVLRAIESEDRCRPSMPAVAGPGGSDQCLI